MTSMTCAAPCWWMAGSAPLAQPALGHREATCLQVGYSGASSGPLPMAGQSEVKSLSRVRLFATPWTVAYQTPLSMGFSRQEYWSGLPFPSPGHLPDPGIKPGQMLYPLSHQGSPRLSQGSPK